MKRSKFFFENIPEGEWFIKLDRVAYARIIYNLLSNAVKHGQCTLIKVEIQKNKDQVLIFISNNGIAIPNDKISLIFDRLYKCDAATSCKKKLRFDKGGCQNLLVKWKSGGVHQMSEYVIETENLTKKYKNQIVVDRLNLHVQKGKI